MRRPSAETCALLLLLGATLGVYAQVLGFESVTFDDPLYLSETRPVFNGISWEGTVWSFQTFAIGNWHPLTWLSLMIDAEVWGMDAGAFHGTNLALHLVATLLLYAALARMTGARWPSLWVAALFALHPLHVEAVAWISERKEVLSGVFWMATLWSYARYTERPGVTRYIAVFGCMALALLAKPMAVTLPFVLLLLDGWPLGRLGGWPRGDGFDARRVLLRIVEKTPLFVLSAISSVLTVLAQQSSGWIASIREIQLIERLANALLSYVAYLGKALWPAHLSVFYPHPGAEAVDWGAVGALVLLLGISLLVLRRGRRSPHVLVGWLWYVGTLIPVIGIVQVGGQAMADRYTYIPLTGLFLAVVWSLRELTTLLRLHWAVPASIGAAAMLALATTTAVQVSHWRDSEALYRHGLAVTRTNWRLHHALAATLAKVDRLDESLEQLETALEIEPSYVDARVTRARVFGLQRRFGEAEQSYREALRINDAISAAHYELAGLLMDQGRFDEAVPHYEATLRLVPDMPKALMGLAVAFVRLQRPDEALRHASRLVEVMPDYAAGRELRDALAAGEYGPLEGEL
jgi:tetratricopeptide (TPR) repeat protein